MAKTYNWETRFETAKNLIVHTFTDRVQVEANLKNGEVLVLIDGHIVNTYHNMPMKEYECLLLCVEEFANQLKRRELFKAVAHTALACLIMAMAIVAAAILSSTNL